MNKDKDQRKTNDPAANPDPITKEPGAHPVGTGVGAAVGGAALGGAIAAGVAAGATAGTVAGPIGTAVGAAIGAVAGGLTGKALAEEVNPSVEHEYWRKTYTSRPYAQPGTTYDDYAPAYEYGWEAQRRYADKGFEDVESDLARDWDRAKGKSKLEWERAKQASRDAWDRVRSNKDRRS